MAMRLIQVVVPKRHDLELMDTLRDRPPATVWQTAAANDQVVASCLAHADETESIVDQLKDQFGAVEGFRVVLVSVEAAIPALPEPPKPAKTDDAAQTANGPDAPAQVKPKAAGRVSRDELLDDIESAAAISRVYVWLVVLSALVASIGLMRDSVAVVIGAMVIAPLLGPNIALALATTLGDTGLLRRAVRANAVGVALSLAVAIPLGAIVGVDPSVNEIASRTAVSLGDLALALASGAAGVLAFTTGAPTALVGVMVAVALMPPLVTVGLLIGSGDFADAGGAALLLIANVVCVNLAGIGVFLIQGVGPSSWWEAERARRGTRRAAILWSITLAILILVLVLSER